MEVQRFELIKPAQKSSLKELYNMQVFMEYALPKKTTHAKFKASLHCLRGIIVNTTTALKIAMLLLLLLVLLLLFYFK